MKRRLRLRMLLMAMLDGLMIGMEIHALRISWLDSGAKLFRYYTQDSNIFAALTCAVCLGVNIACLIRNERLPRWTRVLRHLAASCLMLTFVVAAAMLTPMESRLDFQGFMLTGKYLYLHTICPMVMLIQLFLHDGPRLREKHAALALLPTILYAAVSAIMNLLRVYSGPYPFLRVREQEPYESFLWACAILGVNYFLARMLALLSWIGGRRKRKSEAEN